MANIDCGWNEIDWVCEAAQKESSNNFNRYCDWFDVHQDQLTLEKEAHKVSTAYKQLGWSEGKSVKRIMCMPLHLFNILRRIDPDFGRNTPEGKKKLYKFLLRHPEYSVK